MQDLKLDILIIGQEDKYQLFTDADFAIAKSGTNNVEMSLYQLPIIVTYKVNLLTYYLLKLMIKIKFANLINIIANKEIIPEFLQYKCNARDLSKAAIKFLENKSLCSEQIQNSKKSLIAMGLNFKQTPTELVAKYILEK